MRLLFVAFFVCYFGVCDDNNRDTSFLDLGLGQRSTYFVSCRIAAQRNKSPSRTCQLDNRLTRTECGELGKPLKRALTTGVFSSPRRRAPGPGGQEAPTAFARMSNWLLIIEGPLISRERASSSLLDREVNPTDGIEKEESAVSYRGSRCYVSARVA